MGRARALALALVDVGIGNLHSAEKALRREAPAGLEVAVTSDPEAVRRADRIVLPGDGAFPACMDALRAAPGLLEALGEAVRVRGVPFLGICVGMQMMARAGHEHRTVPGLGWIDAEVRRIAPADGGLKVPHMGWNDLRVARPHPVLEGIADGDHAYFVHGYAMTPPGGGQLLATCDYGGPLTAVVAEGTAVGAQFHPEKSQRAGLRLLANFLRWRP